MKLRFRDSSKNKPKRCYFNSFEDAGDYFRGLKYVDRDLNDVEDLITLDQVSLVIFFILSHRSLEYLDRKLRKILTYICRINTHDLNEQFNSYLDRNKQSIMITYLLQAFKELESWSDLEDRDYYDLRDFLEDVGKRIS